MDLDETIQVLYREKERLQLAIASLEELQGSAAAIPAPTESVRRAGRKFMNPVERQEVSQRMKEYWAARRKKP